MSGKKVLVTGGTGYIGSSLVKKLITSNHQLALLVRDIEKAKDLFGNKVLYIEEDSVENMKVEIDNFSPQIVIHLAGYSTSSDSLEDISQLIESNIIFTSNLLLSLENIKLELFVNAASFSEYHNNSKILTPTYFYSATKSASRLIIEYYAKRDGFNFINTILYSVYGKKSYNKKIIDYALESLGSKSPIAMSEGNQKLDFVHIDDIVDLYTQLINNSHKLINSQIDYHIGAGHCYSIRELVQILENLAKKKANINWGVYKNRKVDTKEARADINLAQEELGYSVKYSLKKGLQSYINGETNE